MPGAALAAAVPARLRRRDQRKRQVKESTSASYHLEACAEGCARDRVTFPRANSGGDATDTRVDLPVAFGLGRIDAFVPPLILFIPDSLI